MRYLGQSLVVGLALVLSCTLPAVAAARGEGRSGPAPTAVTSLDGDQWLLAPDPKNVGRVEHWYAAPRPEAKRTKVPWIIQDAFPGYHGVAWYWRDFVVPANDRPGGRYLLRFWAVDYTAEV
jgi:hypothetical protein